MIEGQANLLFTMKIDYLYFESRVQILNLSPRHKITEHMQFYRPNIYNHRDRQLSRPSIVD